MVSVNSAVNHPKPLAVIGIHSATHDPFAEPPSYRSDQFDDRSIVL